MSEETVLYKRTGSVAFLTIDRINVRNAVDVSTLRLLASRFETAIQDENVRVVVITGSGELAFSAGADMAEMRGTTPLSYDTLLAAWQDTLKRIEDAPKPVIAAINGGAYGAGCELAMACHMRLAVDDAKLGQPEIALAHIPGCGATQRLPNLIPIGLAYEYLLTGDPISAKEAHRVGLVNHVWPRSEFTARVFAFAGHISERSPVALRFVLEAVRAARPKSAESGLRLERALCGLVLETEASRQSIENFFARKKR